MPKPQHDRAYAPLPELLREMREDAGLTQRDLAAKLKRPQNAIYRAENAIRRVDVAEFVLWSKACGKSPRGAFDRLLKAMG